MGENFNFNLGGEKMNKFDTLKFLKDHNIPHTQNHHHCTTNRVQVHCPFCPGSKNFHLGLWLFSAKGNCWRCGEHNALKVIQKLLNCSIDKARRIKRDYTTDEIHAIDKIRGARTPPKTIELPPTTDDLNHFHWQYLVKRGFNPQKLIDIWNIKGTGYLGDCRFRIIAPIYFKGQLISYQGRDISSKSKLRYKACKKENEIIPHKETLYGIDQVPEDTVIVVEGITDVWRLGPGAVATFGIEWTLAQVNLLKEFKRIYIWYDEQEQAYDQAQGLKAELDLFTEVKLITAVDHQYWDLKDPAELPQKKADEIMKKLMKGE